jgi:hypothetical protein
LEQDCEQERESDECGPYQCVRARFSSA